MKKLIIAGTASAIILVSSIALAAPGDGMRGGMNKGPMTRTELVARLDAAFAKIDPNGDGTSTKAERDALRKAGADKIFATIDTDNNGQISRAEFDARAAKRGGGGEGRHMGHRGGPGGKHRMGARFDPNGDGNITKAEFIGPAFARFDAVDSNKDGTISAEERDAARAAWKAKRNK